MEERNSFHDRSFWSSLVDMQSIYDFLQTYIPTQSPNLIPRLLLQGTYHTQCIFEGLCVCAEVSNCVCLQRGRRWSFLEDICVAQERMLGKGVHGNSKVWVRTEYLTI